MSQRSRDRRSATSDAARPDRRSLRLIHGLTAYLTMAVALPIALIGLAALAGQLGAGLGLRLGLAALVLVSIPALLADRLLPKDVEQRKPGLVRDVFAGTWAAGAIACLATTGAYTAEPLVAEAARLDDQGWDRAAYLARWMAGPPPRAAEGAPVLAAAEPALDGPGTPAAQADAPAPPLAEGSPDLTLAASADAAAAQPSGEAAGESPEPTPSDGPAPAVTEYSPAQLFSTYAPSVVSIKVGHRGFSSGGTGFIIDDRGTIATNHHVIEDASEVEIKTFDGVELDRVELLASDPEVDLALLRVDPAKLGEAAGPVDLGDSESVEVGEPVSVIGNPLGLEHTLTNGIVSARRVYEGKRYIQMSAPISPGNSGGPVFDRHGQVIAVSVATMFGGQNLNLAVPVSQLVALIADDYPNRRSFGASSW